ncbi:hypothetical protein [Prevotella sp. HUN102]|uniref:hypothetical protein n=1 Tax=Prevotella sp. HUN102 TaxID=1392486 RepID=UPI00048E55D8|nr:hypothetical protein [Prevotella sp. HUN102]
MVKESLDTARAVSDLGMMAVTAGFFLVLSAGLCIACFRWFKSMIDRMLDRNVEMMDELLSETKSQKVILQDISEGLMPETILRIRNTANIVFNLSVHDVIRVIRQVKTENHISDREATRRKIRQLLKTLHDERNTLFDLYTYGGHKLRFYTREEWIDWVADAVETEVYKESFIEEKAYMRVKSVYERIKIDFSERLTS